MTGLRNSRNPLCEFQVEGRHLFNAFQSIAGLILAKAAALLVNATLGHHTLASWPLVPLPTASRTIALYAASLDHEIRCRCVGLYFPPSVNGNIQQALFALQVVNTHLPPVAPVAPSEQQKSQALARLLISQVEHARAILQEGSPIKQDYFISSLQKDRSKRDLGESINSIQNI